MRRLFPAFVAVYILVFASVDVLVDRPDSPSGVHFAVEILFLLLGGALAIFAWFEWRRDHQSLERIEKALEDQREEYQRWRRQAQTLLNGLGHEIDLQMVRWKLTRAQREVALLLIKGYSHKHIAQVLGKDERTVRQHGGAVYKKSGLAGRAELAAFFLKDLLLPSESDDSLSQ